MTDDTKPATGVNLAELRALHEAATKGEWLMANVDQGVHIFSSACVYVGETRDLHGDDAAFIVRAHTEWLAMLDEIARLRAMMTDEDIIQEALSDSLYEDWNTRDGAQAVAGMFRAALGDA